MLEDLREMFFDSKEFTPESLNVQGYSIVDVGKRRSMSDKFKGSADFTFDPEHLADALDGGGKVYAYKKNGKVMAMYIVHKEENCFSCDEIYYSPEIRDEPVTGLMDGQVIFLIAQRAMMSKDTKAVFKGSIVPKLSIKKGTFNWIMAVAFTFIYGSLFYNLMGASGIGVGVAMGVAMGFCFSSNKYFYENTEG